MRTQIPLTLTLAAALAGGCAWGDWLSYGYDYHHFSMQPNERILTPDAVQASLHQNFDFVIPSVPVAGDQNNSFSASPSIYNDVAYIGALNGTFYAIYGTGPLKGTIKWQYPPLGAEKPDRCGITNQPLLIATGSGNPSGPGIASSAAIVPGVPGHDRAVIFGAPDGSSNGGDGRVWALDAETGQCIWKSPVVAPTSGTAKIGYSSPLVAHGRVYLGISAKMPDFPITTGHLFAVNLADGSLDTNFHFVATNGPPGGGIWSSPSMAPDGHLIVTTGNSCHSNHPPCEGPPPIDFSLSILKLDWKTGKVLWQVQPVPFILDEDPDFGASATVGAVSCGVLAITVQKDGYVYAVDVGNDKPSFDRQCSSPGNNLKCPRWSFPRVAKLPFRGGTHTDTRFIRMAAMDGDRLYIIAGGPATSTIPELAATNRLYSLDVCGSDENRIRWVIDVPDGNAPGAPSTANGVIYIGTQQTKGKGFDFSPAPRHLLAYADTTVRPPASFVCGLPVLSAGAQCSEAGFKDIPMPVLLKDVKVIGGIPSVPAISNGQIYVATAAGHLMGFTP